MTPQEIVATKKSSSMAVIDWNDPKMQMQIKEMYGSKLNEQEWKIYLGVGQATGLNPFLKEIWAIKYTSSSPASIFIGRDGYRKIAQSHPEYDYHESNAVYANDTFEIDTVNGAIKHAPNLKDRGEVVGAYCLVKRKSSSRPVVTYIDRKEYDKKQSVWLTMPATMCKKVAEAHGLRASFSELFSNTYDESEEPRNGKVIDVPTITADEIIAKLESAQSLEAYELIKEEIMKDMGSLSDTEKTKVMNAGKKIRSSLTKKEEVVKDAEVVDDTEQSSIPMQ